MVLGIWQIILQIEPRNGNSPEEVKDGMSSHLPFVSVEEAQHRMSSQERKMVLELAYIQFLIKFVRFLHCFSFSSSFHLLCLGGATLGVGGLV